jgi:anti-anti-sigma regulatory factor
MLRIIEVSDAGFVTFCLAGRLAGEWAKVLEECWREFAGTQSTSVRVDLSQVTFVDDAGKRLLVAMAKHGSELIAADVLMQALVDQIAEGVTFDENPSPESAK